MPLLEEFRMMIVCTFMENRRDLLRDEWEIGTYFDARNCRQQYLDLLHDLAEEYRANAVAVSDVGQTSPKISDVDEV
ncbi:hypothetical protein QM012_005568 [Aureobasidium pullulans]|uniref:Uncharacterized protein n=1 Tax=Aureobasidium pullulans TaxID=5580 RepID=A0ABR0T5N3_AURPU